MKLALFTTTSFSMLLIMGCSDNNSSTQQLSFSTADITHTEIAPTKFNKEVYPPVPEWRIDSTLIDEYDGWATLNGHTWWITQTKSWIRSRDNAGTLEFSCPEIEDGPSIILEFRDFSGVGSYSFGWQKNSKNTYTRVFVDGKKLQAHPEKSCFTISEFNPTEGTISGSFNFYFDTQSPQRNQHAKATHGLHFASGVFEDVRVDML